MVATMATGGTLAAVLALPTSAGAITVSSLTAQPSSTQAGSHPNFTMAMRFGPGDTPKAMTIQLPAGLVGNPNAVEKCPVETFQAGGCSPASAVGSTTVYVSAEALPGTGGTLPGLPAPGGGNPLDPVLDPLGPILGPLGGLLGGGQTRAASRATSRAAIPITAAGTVYNLQPNPGEPARLGIDVQPTGSPLGAIRLQSAIDLRDTTDFGLTSILDGLPNSFSGVPTTITGLDLTLLGATPGGGTFMTLPTSCGQATTRVTVTGHSGRSDSASASFTPTGCESLPFTPGLGVVPETTRVDSPSGYAITLAVPGEEQPVRQAHVERVQVVLPLGTGLNPGTAAGLEACTDKQFGQGARGAPSCPAASAIGTVSFTSPLVGTLNGTVYEGEPKPSQMLRLFVDVPGPGFRIKLLGNVDPDAQTGQVTSTFAGLPQLPFTDFTLRFRGGDKAILTTPPSCGLATSTASLVPFSGTATAGASSQFGVSYDGGSAACPDPMPFAPSVGVDASPATAGAGTSLTQTISRDDRTQHLGDMQLSFPPGLLGGLGEGIGLCDLAKARAGDCPKDSRVGAAQLIAGPGGAPLALQGDVYLTVPIDGSLAGLAITVPGKVGPFDLGTTVSFARIAVRPGDAGLEVTARNLPQIVGGIPLSLRQIKLTLDRKGFMRNATSCAEQQITATFTSSLGATATGAAPYRATDCEKVPFKPKLVGALGNSSQLKKGSNPEVTAVVTQGAGEISNREVKVTLPPEVAVAIDRLGLACLEGQDCGERNTVGTATAVTPLLPIPLSGPVKLVAPAAGGLPVLKVQLSGLLSMTLIGSTALTPEGRVQNTFAGIPDVPLSRFELKLKGGAQGLLVSMRDLRCGAKLKGNGQFTGHSGATRTVTGTFEVCGKIKSAASRRAKAKASGTARMVGGALRVRIKGARTITGVRMALPKQARLKGARGVTVRGGRRARLLVRDRSVTATRLSSRTVTLTVGKQTLRGGKAAVHRKAKLTVRVTMGKSSRTLRLRMR
jgi:hypothetical protein